MSENVNIHFSGRKTWILSGRMLCSTEGACCKPTAARSIVRWLLQGEEGKTRQGMFPSYQQMMNTDPVHVKTLPNPSNKTLIAFIHTPLLCEKSYMQHIGELWLWLQANFRSQTFLFSKLHLRSEKGSCPLVLKKNMFLFDAKIKAFSKALWCARQKDMQADSEGGLVFSNYQHSFWILLPRQNFNVK